MSWSLTYEQPPTGRLNVSPVEDLWAALLAGVSVSGLCDSRGEDARDMQHSTAFTALFLLRLSQAIRCFTDIEASQVRETDICLSS